VGVGSAAKGATAWSKFSCGARWRRAGWSTSPPECPDMHRVEDRRVLHDRPTSAGVAAAAGSGGGVGVGAHKGSRFSSRLRGGPGSGGGGQRVGTRPPGADGSGHRRSTPGGVAGVGAGSPGRAETRMAVRAPEASRCLVRVTAPATTSSSGAPAPAASAATIRKGSASCRAAFKVEDSGGGTPSAATALPSSAVPGSVGDQVRAEGPVPQVRVRNMAGAHRCPWPPRAAVKIAGRAAS